MSDWTRSCWLCGRNGASDPLDEHHIFEGTSNRANSRKYDVSVWLCHHDCHIFGPKAAHNNRETAERLHRYGQRRVMLREGWNVDEFRMVFGRNWLDDEELAEIEAIQRGESDEPAYDENDFCATDEVFDFAWAC